MYAVIFRSIRIVISFISKYHNIQFVIQWDNMIITNETAELLEEFVLGNTAIMPISAAKQ